jgi:hypothetical protein
VGAGFVLELAPWQHWVHWEGPGVAADRGAPAPFPHRVGDPSHLQLNARD